MELYNKQLQWNVIPSVTLFCFASSYVVGRCFIIVHGSWWFWLRKNSTVYTSWLQQDGCNSIQQWSTAGTGQLLTIPPSHTIDHKPGLCSVGSEYRKKVTRLNGDVQDSAKFCWIKVSCWYPVGNWYSREVVQFNFHDSTVASRMPDKLVSILLHLSFNVYWYLRLKTLTCLPSS